VTSSSFPSRFRRRIAIAFVAVAGLSAGALALGAAVTVHSYRTTSFEDRARSEARDDLRLLRSGARPEVIAGRLADAEQPGGPAIVVIVDGDVISSVESVDLGNVPAALRRRAAEQPGGLAEGRATLRSGSALVLGAVLDDPPVEAYFFFPREDLDQSLLELRATLLIGWVVVVVVAGVAGTLVARRALRPVRTAADAARSVAEGILDTRLPIRSTDELGCCVQREGGGARGQDRRARRGARP
jgi:HAMP domain-containing protein